MQPNNQVPSAPPPIMPSDNHSQYGFIMNPQTPVKKSMLSGQSTKQRILIVAFLGTIGLIIVAIFISILASSGKSSTTDLVKITQEQAEIIRLSTDGITKARSQDTLNLSTTTKISITTDQVLLIKQLAVLKHKVSTKELALGHSLQTDQQLTTAAQDNNYDAMLKTILNNELAAYQASLRSAYNSAQGANTKRVLASAYADAAIIIGTKT